MTSSLVIEENDNQFNQFTSLVIIQVEGKLLIFIGTGNGELLKVHKQCMWLANTFNMDYFSITL